VSQESHDPHAEAPGVADARLIGMIRLAGIIVLVLGALAVLRVFLPAILLAGVVCLSTWPLFLRLRKVVGGRTNVAALFMVTGMIVLVAGPTALLSVQLADQVAASVDRIKPLLEQAPEQPPAWLAQLPLVGELVTEQWQTLAAGGDEAAALLRKLMDPAKDMMLGLARAIGGGLLQMLFAAFVGFFLFRDGEAIQRVVGAVMARLAGGLGGDLLDTIRLTVTSVVNGLFGAALAQALVALAGFLIAGVPGAFLLASGTLFLSIIPVGPPLLWGGASLWLFSQGEPGWAVFMLLWGVLLISTVDNVVRPYLISRGSRMSMLLVVLGVVGGIAAFGFAGIFIGPPILAVGLALVRRWTAHQPA